MPRCHFCRMKRPVHEMEISIETDDGRHHYCSVECSREERRVEAVEDGLEDLARALDRAADAVAETPGVLTH